MTCSTKHCRMMQNKIFLLVVIFKCVLSADQSSIRIPEVRPISVEERASENDTPEVVLQLKYDGGELERVYFTQFRKPESKKRMPPVPGKIMLCADLCHAGLGGKSCGPSCQKLIPVTMQSVLTEANVTDVVHGQPRYSVCPVLCENNLGNPLCNCVEKMSGRPEDIDWDGICNSFCADGYTLEGCPLCQSSTTATISQYSQGLRVLNTSDGWVAWCNVQCIQGQGGAACNCDRSPL